jgi:hypothetical protein
MDMSYLDLVKTIPVDKREKLSDSLVDFLLRSKKEHLLSNALGNELLTQWSRGTLATESGLAVVLEAAMVLNSEKTVEFMEGELQRTPVVRKLRELG